MNAPRCLGVTKEKVPYSEINSSCDFHENVEELDKTDLTGVSVLAAHSRDMVLPWEYFIDKPACWPEPLKSRPPAGVIILNVTR